jgi:uncharacterized membrane protein
MTEPQPDQVHVNPHLHELVHGVSETPQQAQVLHEQRDVNYVVHQMLIIGLISSTTLMLIGLALDVFFQRVPPTTLPDLGDVVARVLTLHPSGFFAAGLIVLIATPVLRVLGSIIAFLYERDWLFVGITTLVFCVVVISAILGRG